MTSEDMKLLKAEAILLGYSHHPFTEIYSTKSGSQAHFIFFDRQQYQVTIFAMTDNNNSYLYNTGVIKDISPSFFKLLIKLFLEHYKGCQTATTSTHM